MVSSLFETARKAIPIIHQITNYAVATQSANTTLALGGSPIMASEIEEMEDLNKICGSVLLNIGISGSGVAETIYHAGS